MYEKEVLVNIKIQIVAGCLTILVKQLLDSNFLGIEHQGSHVIVVGDCSKTWTKVGPCFIPE